MHIKVMRKPSTEAQQACRALTRVLMLIGIFLSLAQALEPVSATCNTSSSFNLSTFSSDSIKLVSRAWIDGDGFIRMAPPTVDLNASATNVTNIVNQNPFGAGQVLYRTPISLLDLDANLSISSFSTFFSFSLITRKDVPRSTTGMAFVMVRERAVVLPESVGKPLLAGPYYNVWADSSLHLFAVQLDGYQGDPGSNATDGQIPEIYSSYLRDAAVNFAWIDYDPAALRLDVRVSNTSTRPEWVLLSQEVDLTGLFLDIMYIGFSSAVKLTVQRWNFTVGCSALTAGVQSENVNRTPGGQSRDLTPARDPQKQSPGEVRSKDAATSSAVDSRRKATGSSKPLWHNHRLMIYIGTICGGTLIACVLLAFGMRRAWRTLKNRRARSTPDRDITYAPQIFSYRALSTATNGFDERALLGRGAFGSVYKGLLAEHQSLVAVKRIESDNDAQRERQFIAEVASIGRVRHPNLVQLLGWCHEKGELLLVYDYMSNGSLDRLLFATQGKVLPWESRYNIVKGVATALAFLHGEWEKQVVHRDVKASNVLLDSNFNPRLGDFGLARLIEHNKNHKSTGVAGTKGYLAPELGVTGKATDKTDVFSFGAVALEVACGRRPIERSLPTEEIVLVDFAWGLHSKGELLNALDSRLQRGRFTMEEVVTVMSLGLLCSHPDPAARPTMRQVVGILNGDLPCPVVPSTKPPCPFFSPCPPPLANWDTTTIAPHEAKSSKPSNRTQSRVSDCSFVEGSKVFS